MNAALTGERVLVVEDEYFIADDLAQALAAAGAEVVGPLKSRSDALAWLDSNSADFAVRDPNLEGESGIEIADVLKRRNVPFVFATGYDETAIPERHRDVPFWEKPFDVNALVQALERTQLDGTATG